MAPHSSKSKFLSLDFFGVTISIKISQGESVETVKLKLKVNSTMKYNYLLHFEPKSGEKKIVSSKLRNKGFSTVLRF